MQVLEMTPEDRLARLEEDMALIRSAIADVQTILSGRVAFLASDHDRITTLEGWMEETSETMHSISERLTAASVVLMPPGVPLFTKPTLDDPAPPGELPPGDGEHDKDPPA